MATSTRSRRPRPDFLLAIALAATGPALAGPVRYTPCPGYLDVTADPIPLPVSSAVLPSAGSGALSLGSGAVRLPAVSGVKRTYPVASVRWRYRAPCGAVVGLNGVVRVKIRTRPNVPVRAEVLPYGTQDGKCPVLSGRVRVLADLSSLRRNRLFMRFRLDVPAYALCPK